MCQKLNDSGENKRGDFTVLLSDSDDIFRSTSLLKGFRIFFLAGATKRLASQQRGGRAGRVERRAWRAGLGSACAHRPTGPTAHVPGVWGEKYLVQLT